MEETSLPPFMVLVTCWTFNHHAYIESAMNGFVMQKTTFPYVCVILDDASTDGEPEVIKTYFQENFELLNTDETNDYVRVYGRHKNNVNCYFLVVYLKYNHYSIKKSKTPYYQEYQDKAKYISLCEGDDYWIDAEKLQRQVIFLEVNGNYSLSAENGIVLHTKTGKVCIFSNHKLGNITQEELLNHRIFPTASVMIPQKFFLKLKKISFDTFIWSSLAELGEVHFNAEVSSSIYRRGPGITENDKIKWAYISESFNKEIEQNFNLTKLVRRARNKTLFYDLLNGGKAAFEKRDYKESIKFVIKAIYLSPTSFSKKIIEGIVGKITRKIDACKIRFWNLYYKINKPSHLTPNVETNPIIVSLTSYPARFKTLHLCIKSILNQSLKPRKIVLYLDKVVTKNECPRRLLALEKYGLEIKCICEDIKPHNKYYNAMKDFPNDAIITIDDDCIYPTDTIKSLYDAYLQYSQCICARRVHKIARGIDGLPIHYNDWDWDYREELEPSMELLATGVGGVLYPPHIFDMTKPYFDVNTISTYCLKADDIWLKFIEWIEKVPVKWVQNNNLHPYPILDSELYDTALSNDNVFENQNDIYIKECISYFGINKI